MNELTLVIWPTEQPRQTARFGFLSSAKNLVANVWNRGAGGSNSNPPAKPTPAPAPPARMPPPSISSKSIKEPPKVQSMTKKTPVIPGSSGMPPILKEHASSVSIGKRVPSGSSLAPAADSTITPRPQIPTINAPGSSSKISNNRTVSAAGVSSLGVASRTSNAGGTLKGTVADLPVRARTSTLMAPTASSLAKKSRLPVPTFSPLQMKGKDKEKQMTNSPMSPFVQGRIFSQPLALVSPTTKPAEPQKSLGAAAATLTVVKPPIPPKPTVMPGRRPRISRGKVIAKLASQRETQGGGVGATQKPHAGSSSRTSASVPKVRSSMSANIGRQTHGVARTRGSEDVVMSAKKRARRSEYVRRRTHVDGEGMNVDG